MLPGLVIARKFLVLFCVVIIILEGVYTNKIVKSIRIKAFQGLYNAIARSEKMQSTVKDKDNSLLISSERGLTSGIYYSNWSPYKARKHFPHDIDFRRLTEVFYSFLVVNGETGECQLSDEWSDVQMDLYKQMFSAFEKVNLKRQFPQSSRNDLPLGCIGELFYLKYTDFLSKMGGPEDVKNFKTIMSVGGWSNREAFESLVQSPAKMNVFINSCVDQMFKYGFDGIDIDWEFPKNDSTEPKAYLDMMRSLRKKLDDLESDIFGTEKHTQHFLLTSAISADPSCLEYLPLGEIDRYVDQWNLMAYDFSGAWSRHTAYQSNLYSKSSLGKRSENSEGGSADTAVRLLLNKHKLPAKKIVLGMPAYGRGFKGVSVPHHSEHNVIGQSFQQVSGLSEGESGISLYNQLPLKGGQEWFDQDAVSAYSVKLASNKEMAELVVYDNVQSMKIKAQYVLKNNLGGGFWWESCGENYLDNSRSLTRAFTQEIKYLNKTVPTIYALPQVGEYYHKKYPDGFLASII